MFASSHGIVDDLVQDMIDVLTSFCARLYGRRSAKNRALNAISATRVSINSVCSQDKGAPEK